MPIKKFLTAGADLLAEFYDKTPTERLRTASERATYDPEDGGLGLAPGNTSEERANRCFRSGCSMVVAEQATLGQKVLGKHHTMFLSSNPDLAVPTLGSRISMTVHRT